MSHDPFFSGSGQRRPTLAVSAETARFWEALDKARRQMPIALVDGGRKALRDSAGLVGTDMAAKLAHHLLVVANEAADALFAIESAQLITDPHRDDRVQAAVLFYRQLLEAIVNDRRAKSLIARAAGGLVQ